MTYAKRKIRNQELYKVFNADTGRVHAMATSKKNANIQLRILNKHMMGGSLSADEIEKFVSASYGNEDNVNQYQLDKDLSTGENKVYHNPSTGKLVVANRGTEGSMADWTNNLAIPLGVYDQTSRYKRAEDVQRKAIDKYGKIPDENVGHSQSGAITHELNKKGLTKEVINVNPANFFQKQQPNEFNIRSSADPVSMLTNLNPFKRPSRNTDIKATSFNPFTEHSAKILGRVNPSQLFGRGRRKLP